MQTWLSRVVLLLDFLCIICNQGLLEVGLAYEDCISIISRWRPPGSVVFSLFPKILYSTYYSVMCREIFVILSIDREAELIVGCFCLVFS